MTYTDAQLDTLARVVADAYMSADDADGADYSAAAEAARKYLDALEPDRDDPELVTWTPEQGPLDEALADLPEEHPVTILGEDFRLDAVVHHYEDRHGFWHHLYSTVHPSALTVIRAEWHRPQPAWATPRLPLAVAAGELVYAIRADGTYSSITGTEGVTPAQLDHGYCGRVRVLIDADGNIVEDQQ